jgi:hypothetical protein
MSIIGGPNHVICFHAGKTYVFRFNGNEILSARNMLVPFQSMEILTIEELVAWRVNCMQLGSRESPPSSFMGSDGSKISVLHLDNETSKLTHIQTLNLGLLVTLSFAGDSFYGYDNVVFSENYIVGHVEGDEKNLCLFERRSGRRLLLQGNFDGIFEPHMYIIGEISVCRAADECALQIWQLMKRRCYDISRKYKSRYRRCKIGGSG